MDGIDSAVETENRKPQISVNSWREIDEPNDELYANFPRLGFSLFRDLMQTLREEYPNNEYPSDNILDRINPDMTDHWHLATYMAYDGEKPVGAIIGDEELFSKLKGLWFIVDPKYRGGEVTKKLLQAVRNDFDTVTLLASEFSGKLGLTEQEMLKRQERLVNYYKRLGFEIDVSSDMYRYVKIPGAPIPMLWHK